MNHHFSNPIKSFLVMKNKIHNIYTPKTQNQVLYNNILIKDTEYLLSVIGPAGTGKTLLACVKAIEKLKENKIEKLIITRPVISVEDENIGFLPGNIEKKMDPWVRPIYDVFLDFYSKKEINYLVFNNKIEISPLGFMRGRTFKNSFIIADEMQNSSPNQMIMLTTRIGTNSKMVITGDLKQTDRTIDNNGLSDLIQKINTFNKHNTKLDNETDIEIIEFEKSDIERSPVVEKLINIYNFEVKENKVKINTVTTNYNRTNNYNIKYDSDAALIPIHLMPRNMF
jgi:phosphate starvation-inducible PhoH-like protein